MRLRTLVGIVLACVLVFSAAPAFAAGPASAATLWPGNSGAAVSHVQHQLQTLGFFGYPTVTGYYGPITYGAVRSFQDAYGLPVSGGADGTTVQELDRAVAMQQLAWDTAGYTGVPYQWGGADPSTGFDCSGFVWYMFQTHGRSLPRLTSEQFFTMGTPIDRSHLQPGDLVFFHTEGTASHMGIYIGNNQWVSATSSRGIKAYSMDNPYWAPLYDGARSM